MFTTDVHCKASWRHDASPRGQHQIEIRRFPLPREACSLLSRLREELMVVFPQLRNHAFQICWTDSDGDNIVIGADRELAIAFSERDGHVFKIIVETKMNTESPTHATQVQNQNERKALKRRAFDSEQRMDNPEQRMDYLGQRMDNLEHRMDNLEQRMDNLEQEIKNLRRLVEDLKATVEGIQAALAGLNPSPSPVVGG
ncbi:hypothetical protein TCAL_15088 [Tigriopus californicus]|uniref:PB1 domain-containing protein n=1 Tax=Tigriopus californicus TaxID=6832 RepID=A0A553NVH2_TIGCA|nr:uncharacterized protein LOC131887811 [Tigriopus californicus]TRY69427.1 hypothetical protein TCAL_15088 [Tigriopus californicus]